MEIGPGWRGGRAINAKYFAYGLWALSCVALIAVVLSGRPRGEKTLPDSNAAQGLSAQPPVSAATERQNYLEMFNFASQPAGTRIVYDGHPVRLELSRLYELSFSDIYLLSIEKASDTTIRLHFKADVAAKSPTVIGGFPNNATSHDIQFVFQDSYQTLGYGSAAQRFLDAEPLHLLDGNGRKYKAINGIEGVQVVRASGEWAKAVFPFERTTPFYVTFPIPDWPSSSLQFVFPPVNGTGWSWTIYSTR